MSRVQRHVLSNTDFPPDRAALLRTVVSVMQRSFSLNVLDHAVPFDYRMEVVLLEPLMLARLRTSPVEVSLGISDAPGDSLVIEIPCGRHGFDTWQGGQHQSPGAGDALISLGRLARRNRAEHAAVVLILQLPLQPFLPLLGDLSACPMRLIDRHTPGLRALVRYLEAILDDEDPRDPALLQLMARQLQELSLALVRVVWPPPSGPRRAASRLDAAKAQVQALLAAGELSEHSVARALGVSASALRKLFVVEGGFGRYVRRQRLQLAHRLLQDPDCAGMTVIQIAEACGFGDISTFNRQFRRSYLATPSAVRAGVPVRRP